MDRMWAVFSRSFRAQSPSAVELPVPVRSHCLQYYRSGTSVRFSTHFGAHGQLCPLLSLKQIVGQLFLAGHTEGLRVIDKP